jgi:hypothetical protein
MGVWVVGGEGKGGFDEVRKKLFFFFFLQIVFDFEQCVHEQLGFVKCMWCS